MEHDIKRGDRVVVRTAFDQYVPRRAATGATMGEDFMVVRVCTEDEWAAAQAESREARSTPWPAEDVHLAEQAVDA
jgi:hypothetical protein